MFEYMILALGCATILGVVLAIWAVIAEQFKD